MSAAIEPMRVEVDDETLADLKERLARTRWPDQIPDTAWDYGTELGYLRELCAYWRDKFDWRSREQELNQLSHQRTVIDGQPIHFVHARSRHEDALPILLSHGWPGSFVEFLKVIGPLTDPTAHGGRAEDAFHVVAPSLPGYGLSGPTRERGWDPQRIAEAEIELMSRLGYARYGAQGGDWGAIITTQVGRLDPQHCAGIHLNMTIALPPDPAKPDAGLSEKEKQWVAQANLFRATETGYYQIQGTKPQTLAYGLNDSPAGLAGWIVEKFRTWSDCGGDVESKFSKDELLTNITLYWVTQTINASTRLYYETMKSGRVGFTQGRVEVPTGCAIFPKEIYKTPRSWMEKAYAVSHWTEMPRGGHFAAMEEPGLLVEDVRKFFATLR